MCFSLGLLLFSLKVYRLLLCLQNMFIPCVIQLFLFFIVLYWTGKLAGKMFKKVHRNGLNIWLESVSIYLDYQVSFCSRIWEFMIISVSVNLVLYFEGNLFIVAYIYLIVRIWASCSDRQFIIGDIEDKFILLLSTNILSVAVLELFWILVAKLPVCDRLYVCNDEASCWFWLSSMK